MSRHPKVVPWHSGSEISTLRDWFYPEQIAEYDDIDTRRRAIARVKAYQTRGPVPESIESTANLMSALLNDDIYSDSQSVRLGYSMAIVRFVNGLLDPFQKSRDAISMYTLAKSAGLPSFFVELRHVATHESLPSLELLRTAARRALDWLWFNFWYLNNSEGDSRQREQAEIEKRKEEIKELMRLWRRMRRADPTKIIKPGDTSAEGQKFWKLVKDIQSVLNRNEEVFIEVLFTMNVLIPTAKNGIVKRNAVEPSIKLFEPLLDILNKDNNGFMDRLVKYGMDLLNAQPSPFEYAPRYYRKNEEQEEEEEEYDSSDYYTSITKWIKHFISPRAKKTQTPWLSDLDSTVRDNCLSLPRWWNSEILCHYVELYPSTVSASIARISKDMAEQVELEGKEEKQSSQSHNGKRKIELELIQQETGRCVKRVRQAQGTETTGEEAPAFDQTDWVVSKGWSPRPIGIL